MPLKILEKQSLSRKLFFVLLGISLFPLIICLVFFLKTSAHAALIQQNSTVLFCASLILLTIILAALSALSFSKRINEPIRQFTRSATEIARGNFTHKVKSSSDDELGRLARIFNFMTTELRRLNEMNLNKIITEKNKTETILKNIADGVIVTDPNHKILVLNSIAESWFGLTEMEVIDQPIEKLIYEQKLLSLINDVINGNDQENASVEIEIKPADRKKSIVLQAKAAQVINTKHELIGIVTVFRDVTKEKEIDKMKTDLVSMVAHELRSPLTSIAGFSELLLDSGVSQDQSKEYAEIILKESNRLGDLINKFLDISRIESGKSQVNKTYVNMKHVIENILEMNMYLAEQKGMDLQIEIPEDLSTVWVDQEMMGEVVLNLFSNAVKYSPDGKKIIISVEDNAREQVVSVIDQGYGIGQKSIDKIFNKFYRVTDNENIQDVTGSGLGLSLVKEIVELHDGAIWVESELNKGSRFSFSIPKPSEREIQNEYSKSFEEVDIIE
ncbi:MAG: HAMP domain-containing sensor histidine kinase [Candidatus Zhuqueibacterota bacterium]